MPDLNSEALIEITVEIVAAYVTRNHIQAADMPNLIVTVHGSLAGMGSAPEPVWEAEKPVPPVSIRRSLTDDYLVSLEDGKRYKSLKRHLSRMASRRRNTEPSGAARGLPHGRSRLCAEAERAGEKNRPRQPQEERLSAARPAEGRTEGSHAER